MAGYVYRDSARTEVVSLAQLPGAPRIVAATSAPLQHGARPQFSRKKREQIAMIADGLTLACVDRGLLAVPNDRRYLEHAITTAWRGWTPRVHFDCIRHAAEPAGELLADALLRSGRRLTSLGGWHLEGYHLVPSPGRGVDVTSGLAGLRPVHPEGWQSLADALIRTFGPMAQVEGVRRSA